jgi:CBS domain-containing protein
VIRTRRPDWANKLLTMRFAPTPAPSGSAVPGLDSITVAQAMRTGIVTCPPTTPLAEVAATMAELQVDSVVVVDDRQPAWGVLSVLDIVAAAIVRALDEQVAGGSAVMPAATVSADEPLRRAAELMTARKTPHLIVTEGRSARPTGVLTAHDIAAALAL